jgi:HNH endonuclease
MGFNRRGGGKSNAQGSGRNLQTRVNSNGYAQFKDPRTGTWTLTHRRVAEKLVGGRIFAGREVHHIDGDKTNNRPSNLQIVSPAEHRAIHRTRK